MAQPPKHAALPPRIYISPEPKQLVDAVARGSTTHLDAHGNLLQRTFRFLLGVAAGSPVGDVAAAALRFIGFRLDNGGEAVLDLEASAVADVASREERVRLAAAQLQQQEAAAVHLVEATKAQAAAQLHQLQQQVEATKDQAAAQLDQLRQQEAAARDQLQQQVAAARDQLQQQVAAARANAAADREAQVAAARADAAAARETLAKEREQILGAEARHREDANLITELRQKLRTAERKAGRRGDSTSSLFDRLSLDTQHALAPLFTVVLPEHEHLHAILMDQAKCRRNPSKTCHWSKPTLDWCAGVFLCKPAAYGAMANMDVVILPSEDTVKRHLALVQATSGHSVPLYEALKKATRNLPAHMRDVALISQRWLQLCLH